MTDRQHIEQLEQRVKTLEEAVITLKEDTLNEVKSWWQAELQNAMCPPSN